MGLGSFLEVPDQVTEPPALAARPHHGGFPIPFITAIVDGRPDFKVHDQALRASCATRGLCQLCGTEMEGGEMAFVGFPRSIERRVFGEPPAHPACLDYAFSVCPWLAGRGWAEGWEEKARVAGITVAPTPAPAEVMGVLYTDRFWLVDDDEGVSDFKFHAGEPTRAIEWRSRG